eukprot:TRINITY_DN2376_c0_g1_i2.p1 TRINITY_DN2376_c0_g1~~TRINITY_DN2376_c0_g1_i2.p1  ORF type:complete len:663 (-),score=125.67 TRINITY_DN2376_c0_g1_i2:226-2214(-)
MNMDPTSVQKPRGHERSESSSEDYKFLDKIRVTVHEGRNLAVRDKRGTSDPYVIIKLRGKGHHQKSKTEVCDETLNPKWEESSSCFLFEVEEDELPSVKFVCWDKNRASKDEFMGQFIVQVEEVVKNPETFQAKWFPLGHGKRKRGKHSEVSGEMRASIDLIYSTLNSESEGKQRAKFFRKFPNVPMTEKILYVHAITLVKKVPLQGHLFILTNYICFYPLIMRKKKISFRYTDISNVEKKRTAIEISLKSKTYTFQSLTATTKVFDEIELNRKNEHPNTPTMQEIANIRSSLNIPILEVEEEFFPRMAYYPLKERTKSVAAEKLQRSPSGSPAPVQSILQLSPRGDSAAALNTSNPNLLRDSGFKPGHRRGRSVGLAPTATKSGEFLSVHLEQTKLAPINITIEIDNYKDLKVQKSITMTIHPFKPIQSLFNKLGEDCIPIEILSDYSLKMMPVSGKSKKIVLDPIQSISQYPITDGTVLYLKKRKRQLKTMLKSPVKSLTLNVEIQNFRELGSMNTTTLALETELTTDDVLEKIITEGNVSIPDKDIQDYTLYIPKCNGTKGILVENSQSKMADYQVEDKDTIVLVKKCMWKSVYDLYNITESRTPQEICMEFVSHCLLHPMIVDTIEPQDQTLMKIAKQVFDHIRFENYRFCKEKTEFC